MNWSGPEFVLGIIGIGAGCTLLNTWIRARHGYPVENEQGGMSTKDGVLPSERKVELLEAENAALRGSMTRMEDRVAVLERIATDPGARLDREIAGLQTNLN